MGSYPTHQLLCNTPIESLQTIDAMLNEFIEVDMLLGLVRASMGNLCKSCAGEMIATTHRNWCLRLAPSLRFAIEGVEKCDGHFSVTNYSNAGGAAVWTAKSQHYSVTAHQRF